MKNECFNPGYYHEDELRECGFKSVGKNVLVAKNCTIVGVGNISLGDSVRIDGFSTIIAAGDGFLDIGSYVHIGGYAAIFAGAGVIMRDFSGISQSVKLYSKSDDYSGRFMTNPTVPAELTGVVSGTIVLERHVIVGAQSIVMPGITLAEGTSVGANSLVMKNTEEWTMYFGSPAKRIKNRKRNPLELEKQLR
ncbi:putative acyl transferase [Serratia rubidaea]|uniref:Putative acyl transferase n=1 Tax=Serratia rubidaea TaxID=61652 RepID=A0A4U9HNY5_SERRU|nr:MULTISPECIES: acyltransferase [Serratia]AGB83619.1 acetyltransferase (isoleucine patch superfamily) [Serratia sp. FGI94]MDK1705672.1 acyltransferase [Serratia rubidaea]QPR63899.1 acyltransferase [Serratia rubidaea]CAI1057804.1 putative acyl transferase [Serratia rubidaea]CAI1824315.1 putative acyl transferase [Serratia rubidaea]